MLDLRRIPVMAPNGYKFVLVVNGLFIDAMEGGTISERVPEGAIVGFEECDQDIDTHTYYAHNPKERHEF